MTSFALGLNCDNAAFEPDPLVEVVRILRELADRLELRTRLPEDGESLRLTDFNGNRVGHFTRVGSS